MKNLILLIIGLGDLLANAPYIVDTYKRKTKPNLATWTTWSLANGISAVSALAAGGAINTVILASSYFAGSSAIFCLALIYGARKYTIFDGICQSLAVVGVILWLSTHDPTFAIIFAILVDILAALPTLRHAYLYPQEETYSTFLIAGILSVPVLALASSSKLAAIAFPLDSILVNLALFFTIIQRRHRERLSSA